MFGIPALGRYIQHRADWPDADSRQPTGRTMNTMQSAQMRGKGFPSSSRRLRTLWLAGAMLGGLSLQAGAETYNVNVSSDAVQDPATTTNCAALGDTSHCSLRAAIMFGNT